MQTVKLWDPSKREYVYLVKEKIPEGPRRYRFIGITESELKKTGLSVEELYALKRKAYEQQPLVERRKIRKIEIQEAQKTEEGVKAKALIEKEVKQQTQPKQTQPTQPWEEPLQKSLEIGEQIYYAGGLLKPSPKDNPLIAAAKGFGRFFTGTAAFAWTGGSIVGHYIYLKQHYPKIAEQIEKSVVKNITKPQTYQKAVVEPTLKSFEEDPIGTIAEISAPLIIGGGVKAIRGVKARLAKPQTTLEVSRIGYVEEGDVAKFFGETRLRSKVGGVEVVGEVKSLGVTKKGGQIFGKESYKTKAIHDILLNVGGKDTRLGGKTKSLILKLDKERSLSFEKTQIIDKTGKIEEIPSISLSRRTVRIVEKGTAELGRRLIPYEERQYEVFIGATLGKKKDVYAGTSEIYKISKPKVEIEPLSQTNPDKLVGLFDQMVKRMQKQKPKTPQSIGVIKFVEQVAKKEYVKKVDAQTNKMVKKLIPTTRPKIVKEEQAFFSPVGTILPEEVLAQKVVRIPPKFSEEALLVQIDKMFEKIKKPSKLPTKRKQLPIMSFKVRRKEMIKLVQKTHRIPKIKEKQKDFVKIPENIKIHQIQKQFRKIDITRLLKVAELLQLKQASRQRVFTPTPSVPIIPLKVPTPVIRLPIKPKSRKKRITRRPFWKYLERKVPVVGGKELMKMMGVGVKRKRK